MIDLEHDRLSLNEVHDVKAYQVWWTTPLGIFPKKEDAIQRIKALDLDPNLVVRGIVVAVTDNPDVYEVISN